MTNIKAFNCPNCGAPLEIDMNDKFTKCIYCASSVKIKKEQKGMISLELLDQASSLVVEEAILKSLNRKKERLSKEATSLHIDMAFKRIDKKRAQEYREKDADVSIFSMLMWILGILSLILFVIGSEFTLYLFFGAIISLVLHVVYVLFNQSKIQSKIHERDSEFDSKIEDISREKMPIDEEINRLEDLIRETEENISSISNQLLEDI